MGKYLMVTSFLFAMCFSQADVKNEVCWAMCRRDGNDTGKYYPQKKSCVCGRIKEYKEITDKVIGVRRTVTKVEDESY